MEADIVLKNGLVLDGTGKKPYRGDLAVISDKIAYLGPGFEGEAKETLDAAGLAVSPGFIDIHTHGDYSVIASPKCAASLKQGVTTVVVGNCGFSLAPVPEKNRDELLDYLDGIFRWREGEIPQWYDVDGYLRAVEKARPGLNVAALVGHANLRIPFMGRRSGTANQEEREQMRTLLKTSMEQGAIGFSTGLYYSPGVYADRVEISALASLVSDSGGLYSTHMRNEGDGCLESIEEALDVARRTKVRLEISHLKFTGRKNWGKAGKALSLIDEGRSEGLDAAGDVHPYPASMTFLRTLLPPWAREGGDEEIRTRLSHDGERERIIREMGSTECEWENCYQGCGWENTLVEWKGKVDSVSNIADKNNIGPFDLFFDILSEDPGTFTVLKEMAEADVKEFMSSDLTSFASDGMVDYPPHWERKALGHPRGWGTFPTILGQGVREEGIIDLRHAIEKMTRKPAERIRLRNRGVLKKGNRADITIFDPERISHDGDFASYDKEPLGIEGVLVNGKWAVREGSVTPNKGGRALRFDGREVA